MINYSESFKKRVKEAWNNYEEIVKLADAGSEFLGRYLDDGSQGGISVNTVLTATSLEALQQIARSLKIKRDLYSEFWEEKRLNTTQ